VGGARESTYHHRRGSCERAGIWRESDLGTVSVTQGQALAAMGIVLAVTWLLGLVGQVVDALAR